MFLGVFLWSMVLGAGVGLMATIFIVMVGWWHWIIIELMKIL